MRAPRARPSSARSSTARIQPPIPSPDTLLDPLPFALDGIRQHHDLAAHAEPRTRVRAHLGMAPARPANPSSTACGGIGVDVYQIGGTTCGKPYGFYPRDNCGTTYFSIQFKGVPTPRRGFGDYADGFSATRAAPDAQAQPAGSRRAERHGPVHHLGDTLEERDCAWPSPTGIDSTRCHWHTRPLLQADGPAIAGANPRRRKVRATTASLGRRGGESWAAAVRPWC